MKNIVWFFLLFFAWVEAAGQSVNFNTLPALSTVTTTTPLPTTNSSGNWRKVTFDQVRNFVMPRPVTRVAPSSRYVLGYVPGFDSLQYIPGGIISQLPLGNVTIAANTSQWTITNLGGINFVNASAGSGWVNRVQTSRSTTNFLTFKSGQTVTVGTDTTQGAILRWNTTGIYAKNDSMFLTPERLDSISTGEVLTVVGKISNRAYVKFRPSGGSGGSPSGAAGGDLTGTYPNPTIANNAIISAYVLDGTLVNADLASQTIDSNKLKNRAINPLKLNSTGATGGQVLKYNSSTGAVGWAQDSSIYRGSGILRSENTYVQMASDGSQNLGIGYWPDFPDFDEEYYGLFISPEYYRLVTLANATAEKGGQIDVGRDFLRLTGRNNTSSVNGSTRIEINPGRIELVAGNAQAGKDRRIYVDTSNISVSIFTVSDGLKQYTLLPANQVPSTTSAVKQTLVWTGTGSASTVAFENVSSGGGSTPERVFLEGSTATSVDLDVGTTVKDKDGTNTTFTFPTSLSGLRVYKNGILLAETGSLTTRDYSCNTGTNTITFTVALVSTDRVIIEK